MIRQIRNIVFSKIICLLAFFLILSFSKTLSASEAKIDDRVTLTLWHSYAEGSEEYLSYRKAIQKYTTNNPRILIDSIGVPYAQLVQKFITAAQGGEGPDIIRLTSQEIAKIGQISIEGLALLEDLRPHFTPIEKSIFQEHALTAMRYKNALYALPASQSTLSLIYNKDLFDAQNLAYPNNEWTIDDLLSSATILTQNKVYGISFPFKVFLWWAPFQLGFGGSFFDKVGAPSFISKESVVAQQWLFDLELEHKVIAPGKGYDIESMKNQFKQNKAAMIIDGSWNWNEYIKHGMNIGQVLLPHVTEKKIRMKPLLYYLGWSISKRSSYKIEAANVVKWLSSIEVQKEFAINAYTLPTIEALRNDPDLKDKPAFAGFLKQIELGYPAPTTKSMTLIIKPLETAIELSFSGKLEPYEALQKADAELRLLINGSN